MRNKARTFTPIDLFVQTYIMDHPRDIEYNPGDTVSFKSSMMVSPEIEELLAAVDDLGLEIHFEGAFVVWETVDEDETETDEEPIEEPEENSIAWRKAEIERLQIEIEGLELHDRKLEELKEAVEKKTPEEVEADRIEKEMRDLDQEPGRIVTLTEENLEVARDIIAMAEGTPLENTIPLWVRNAVKIDDAEAVEIEEPDRTYAETEADEEAVAVEIEEPLIPEEIRGIPEGEEEPPT
jgi:hypothetical protein